jgi:hypothetical protein
MTLAVSFCTPKDGKMEKIEGDPLTPMPKANYAAVLAIDEMVNNPLRLKISDEKRGETR